jgi:hypothetical protein
MVFHHSVHLRLLRHDFRNPDLIRFVMSPPGEVSLVCRKPVEQGLLEGREHIIFAYRENEKGLYFPLLVSSSGLFELIVSGVTYQQLFVFPENPED